MTDKMNRQQFLQTAVGATLGAVVAANLPAGAGEPKSVTAKGAEKIFRGGTIITMNNACRHLQAVALAGGRILAAGDGAEVMKTKTDATEIVDLGGRTLMPSFIDSHGHFMNSPQIVKWANVSGPPVGPITKVAAMSTSRSVPVGRWSLGQRVRIPFTDALSGPRYRPGCPTEESGGISGE